MKSLLTDALLSLDGPLCTVDQFVYPAVSMK